MHRPDDLDQPTTRLPQPTALRQAADGRAAVPTVPTVLAGGIGIVVSVGLLMAADDGRSALAVGAGAAALLLIALAASGRQVIAPWSLALPAVAAAAVATVVGGRWFDPTLTDLAVVAAAGFGLIILAQLGRGGRRRHVPIAMGQGAVVLLLVTGLASLAMPLTHAGGGSLVRIGLLAAGIGILVAHLVDAWRPWVAERWHAALGIGIGILGGAVISALYAPHATDPAFTMSARVSGLLIGVAAATTALIVDLAVALDAKDRPTADWRRYAATALGALAGIATVGPVSYLLGPMLLSW